VAAQTPIIRAGAPADHMGILYSGRASVVSVDAQTGATRVLEPLRPGDHFGEIGPLLGTAHPQMVMADEACVVLRVGKDVLDALIARVPSFAHALARRLAMRVVQLGVMALRAGAPAPAAAAAATQSAGSPPQGVQAAAPGAGVIPFVEIADFNPGPALLSMVPEKLIREQRVFPLQLKGSKLTVGFVSPRNLTALGELRRVLHKADLEVVAISLDDYSQALVRFKLQTAKPADAKRGASVSADALSFDIVDSEREADKAVRVIGDEIVRALNRIIAAAIEREASDVHIEPEVAGVRIRFRLHGSLVDWGEYLPPSFARGIVARVKILAGLDITERRLPQDGRIALTVDRREVDMRVSSLPTSRGEKVVLRIFEAAGMMRPLERTFVEPGLLAAIRTSLGRTTGAILVCGGTGSGKSTTLYSMLNERRKLRPDSNVVMVEDPIEYRMQGTTQVQVNMAVGLGFAQVLRAVLRQDPDVIAVGETRDADTARTALEAAMTGHLVLTSLHANDAIGSVQRLESLGCPRELVAQSVTLVLVQRLVRRLCPLCARAEAPAPILAQSLAARRLIEAGSAVRVPRAVGCDQCAQTGYQGRVAVIESLQVDEDTRNAIMAGQPLSEVERIALGTKSLFRFGAYASYLMARTAISGADALMSVAG
jgi:type II secretory ATPase GspE/PulE/Tfp pilus assembly ATPase PilB-like protein